MKFKFLFLPVVLLGVGVLSLTGVSCQKKTDCELTVRCVDSVGNPMAGVYVKLYANVKTQGGATVEADLKAEGVSDGSGVSTYTFKLPAILDIKAIAGSRTGQGIVKLEEGKKADKTVTVKY